jgi:hypothetical protein
MFTPSPRQSLSKASTPRRDSSRRPSRNVSVLSGHRSTPLAQTLESVTDNSSRASSVASYAAPGRDAYHATGNLGHDTYAKFDEFEAAFHGYLPPELQFLQNAGMLPVEDSIILEVG